MKVEILSRKLVKPWTPTPSHLKTYKISFLDDLIPPLNLGIPLFYASRPERTSDLEERLSKALVGFYPLAGRFVNKDRAVDCGDQGVEFVRAEAPDVELGDLMGERDIKKLNRDFLGLPIHPDRAYGPDDPLASFQLTELKCGGCVLGISIAHVLLDASSAKTFLDAWSDAGRAPAPNFHAPLLFPCSHDRASEGGDGVVAMDHDDDNVVVKRFLFTAEAVARLRSKLVGNRPAPRVRVVTAFISTALIRSDRAKYGRSRPCVISQPLNMRERTIPPLPKQSCGNLGLVSLTVEFEAADGLDQLVDLISDAVKNTLADCGRMFLPGEDRIKMIKEPLDDFVGKLVSGEVNVMWYSDWTKFGFYEADLGWGRPARISFGPYAVEKMTVLLEDRDGGGVDALVHLSHADMAVLEQDEEMKLFASY